MIDKLNNCNINGSDFSVYNYDGESLQELLSQFFTAINKCIETCNINDSKIDWMLNEGLLIEVEKKMNQFVVDGTFETMINETLLSDINKQLADCLKQYQTLNEIVSSYNQQNDLNIQNINKNITEMLGTINSILDSIKNIDSLYKDNKYKLVTDYGLLNNGDITVPLQKCIDDIHLGKTSNYIYIPEGSYTLSDTIWNLNNLTIEFSPKATITRNANFNIMFTNDIKDSVHSGYSSGGNLIWKGGIISGGDINYMCNPLGFALGENFQIENVTIKRVKNHHALEFTGCKKVRVNNCYFTEWSDLTDNTRYYAEAIQLATYTIDGFPIFGGSSAVGTICQDVEIKNCYCDGFPVFAGCHGGVADFKDRDYRIRDNIIYNASFSAIRIFNTDNVIIEGNKMMFCNRGVYVNGAEYSNKPSSSDQVTICNNMSYGIGSKPYTHFIELEGRENRQGNYYKVYGNKLQVCSVTGSSIFANNINICDIFDNDISSSTSTGIESYSSDNLRIHDNYIDVQVGYGIVITKSGIYNQSSYTIINNNIVTCKLFGIFSNNGFGTQVTNNFLKITGGESETRYAVKFSETNKGFIDGNNCYIIHPISNNSYIVDSNCKNVYLATNINVGYQYNTGSICNGVDNKIEAVIWNNGNA